MDGGRSNRRNKAAWGLKSVFETFSSRDRLVWTVVGLTVEIKLRGV